MQPVERYLTELYHLHRLQAGTGELSAYPPLFALLTEVGRDLKPHVIAVGNLANVGAGHPDAGLFTDRQQDEPVPERGVVEVKDPTADIEAIAHGDQVAKYLAVYRQVLVTNYWQFILVQLGPDGQPALLEQMELADDAADFWQQAAQPRRLAQQKGIQLVEFLQRVMLRPVAVSRPQDVAWFLASYARDALARLGAATPPGLAAVRTALEEALGLTFEDEKGDRFFRSTLIQTLFYGVFSAWVLWHKANPARSDHFDWRLSAYLLRVPVIQVLFEQLAVPSRLKALDLEETLTWVGSVLNRVDRGDFFSHFEEGEAVQYFYEPFLEAFSPQLRKELGVWYTPPEVVTYMVERVDTALRTELGKPDGLADPDVVVLDPACGTGAYLSAVLDRIARTVAEKGETALAPALVKEAAMQRIFGFEILPAPYVIAHLQMGLRLQNAGAPLADGERAGIFLTNALTGWTPPEEPKQRVLLPELAAERDAAERVKKQAKILVVLGNPPYNGFAGVGVAEERTLSDAYRTTEKAPRPQGQGLNDLYVRFFRMAERAIVELSPQEGIVCFISNYSWLDGLSFPGMRERYLQMFDRIWIDRLNGDKYKTGKTTPDGKPDPSIFSTEWSREGIQVGTAVSLLVRHNSQGTDTIKFRDLWGTTKRAQLLASAAQDDNSLYTDVQPVLELGLVLTPVETHPRYFEWPRLPDLFPTSFPGVKTSRDDALVEFDRDTLLARMEAYFDSTNSHEEMARIAPRLMQDASRFNAIETRETLQKRGILRDNIVRYYYRPFDVRWLYWEPETKLLDEKRPDSFPHVFDGNVWVAAAQKHRRDFDPPIVTTNVSSLHVIERGANMFPLYLKPGEALPLFRQVQSETAEPNLSKEARYYLQTLQVQAADLFYHTIATLYAPAYRAENHGALRQDWPRIPLPADGAQLTASATLGRSVAALLDPETAVNSVTAGTIPTHLRVIAAPQHSEKATLNPAVDFAVTAGWGYTVRDGAVTMPGGGTIVERDYTSAEQDVITQSAAILNLTPEDAFALLGDTTVDVYLNDHTYWANVPANVWAYTSGGYQVLKKWLSYREQKVLGRDLTLDEVRTVTHIARRITALLLLQPELDANYQVAKSTNNFRW